MELVKVLARVTKYMEKLSVDDQRQAAFFIYRRWGGPIQPLSAAERARRYRHRHAAVTVDVTPDRHAAVTDSVTVDRHADVTNERDAGGTIGGVKQPKSKGQEASTGFQAFWLKYPKRVGKGAAQDAWNKGTCEAHAGLILQALENQRNFLLREGGKFIPNPATWLNQRRWEDDPPEPTGLSPKTAGNIAAGQAFIERMAQRGKA